LRISLERIEISEIGKASDQLQPLYFKRKKLRERWSTNKKVTGMHVDPPMISTEHALMLMFVGEQWLAG